jgi:hypothetical protein
MIEKGSKPAKGFPKVSETGEMGPKPISPFLVAPTERPDVP